MNCQRTLWGHDEALIMRICVDLDIVAFCVGCIMFMFGRAGSWVNARPIRKTCCTEEIMRRKRKRTRYNKECYDGVLCR
jgi:hypothetical protein